MRIRRVEIELSLRYRCEFDVFVSYVTCIDARAARIFAILPRR